MKKIIDINDETIKNLINTGDTSQLMFYFQNMVYDNIKDYVDNIDHESVDQLVKSELDARSKVIDELLEEIISLLITNNNSVKKDPSKVEVDVNFLKKIAHFVSVNEDSPYFQDVWNDLIKLTKQDNKIKHKEEKPSFKFFINDKEVDLKDFDIDKFMRKFFPFGY